MPKDFNTKFWKFTEGVHTPPEKWVRPGKPEWPDMIVIQVGFEEALRIIQSLASQISHHRDDQKTCELTLPGELKSYDD